MKSVINSTSELVQWRKSVKEDGGGFSEDQLIDAYLQGKESLGKLVKEKLIENINKVGTQTDTILDALKGKKFTPKSASLRINHYNNFDILISLPESQYTSKAFIDFYNFTSNTEQENKDDYKVIFTFINHSKSFDYDQIRLDGYGLVHKTFSGDTKTQSRKT